MRGYKWFIAAFIVLFVLYIVVERNKPKQWDWSLSLSKEDKNPFGSYILYKQLSDLFPNSTIASYRLPVYNQVEGNKQKNTAYLLIDPSVELSNEDITRLIDYVLGGNYAFISGNNISEKLLDTLKLTITSDIKIAQNQPLSLRLSNPNLSANHTYFSSKIESKRYFSKIDTIQSVILGTEENNKVNFLKLAYGEGAFYFHTSPECFSNYFLLNGSNAEYTSDVLSYIPSNVSRIYWDEYYKLGPETPQTPLYFLLNNLYLRWALRLSLVAMILFVLFEMKRRQRIIPVIEPLRNTSLDFVKTVATVYFNQHNNRDIAGKKINYFFDYLRTKFYLTVALPDDELVPVISNRSGISHEEITALISTIRIVEASGSVSDDLLLSLNNKIDKFYKQV